MKPGCQEGKLQNAQKSVHGAQFSVHFEKTTIKTSTWKRNRVHILLRMVVFLSRVNEDKRAFKGLKDHLKAISGILPVIIL